MTKQSLQKLLDDNKEGKGRIFFYSVVKEWLDKQPDDTEEPKSNTRSDQQRKAEHVWFRDIAKMCLDSGVTIQAIFKPTADLQVDEHFIKYLFRRIGKKKYGKESTTQHTKAEIDPIVDEMVKFFAEKVDPPIELPPFPNDSLKQTENLSGVRLAQSKIERGYEYREMDESNDSRHF